MKVTAALPAADTASGFNSREGQKARVLAAGATLKDSACLHWALNALIKFEVPRNSA